MSVLISTSASKPKCRCLLLRGGAYADRSAVSPVTTGSSHGNGGEQLVLSELIKRIA